MVTYLFPFNTVLLRFRQNTYNMFTLDMTYLFRLLFHLSQSFLALFSFCRVLGNRRCKI